MTGAGFWDDQDRARDVVQRVKTLKAWVEPFDRIEARVRTAHELDELLTAEPDDVMERDLDQDVGAIGLALRPVLRAAPASPDAPSARS